MPHKYQTISNYVRVRCGMNIQPVQVPSRVHILFTFARHAWLYSFTLPRSRLQHFLQPCFYMRPGFKYFIFVDLLINDTNTSTRIIFIIELKTCIYNRNCPCLLGCITNRDTEQLLHILRSSFGPHSSLVFGLPTFCKRFILSYITWFEHILQFHIFTSMLCSRFCVCGNALVTALTLQLVLHLWCCTK